jgi:hypothetical protein
MSDSFELNQTLCYYRHYSTDNCGAAALQELDTIFITTSVIIVVGFVLSTRLIY